MDRLKKAKLRKARKMRRVLKKMRKEIKRINKGLDAFMDKARALDLLLPDNMTFTDLIKMD